MRYAPVVPFVVLLPVILIVTLSQSPAQPAGKMYHYASRIQVTPSLSTVRTNRRLGIMDDKWIHDTFLHRQMALAKSRFVLLRALKEEPVAKLPLVQQQPDPLEWLERNLVVSRLGESPVMQIGLQGDQRPQDMTVIVNAITKSYLTEASNNEKHALLNYVEQRKRVLTRLEEWAQDKERQLLELTRATGGDLEAERRRKALYDEQADLKRQSLQLKLEHVAAKVKLERATAQPPALVERLAILTAQQELVQSELKKLDGQLKEVARSNLDLSELKEEIDLLRTRVRKLKLEMVEDDQQLLPSSIQIMEEAMLRRD